MKESKMNKFESSSFNPANYSFIQGNICQIILEVNKKKYLYIYVLLKKNLQGQIT